MGARMFVGLASFVAAVSLIGPVAAQILPSPPEAFNVRVRCKESADKKFQQIGNINPSEIRGSWQRWNYDARAERCYIEIFTHRSAPGSSSETQSRQIFDAETDRLLASAEVKDGKNIGIVFDDGYQGSRFGWDAAVAYISEKMAGR